MTAPETPRRPVNLWATGHEVAPLAAAFLALDEASDDPGSACYMGRVRFYSLVHGGHALEVRMAAHDATAEFRDVLASVARDFGLRVLESAGKGRPVEEGAILWGSAR